MTHDGKPSEKTMETVKLGIQACPLRLLMPMTGLHTRTTLYKTVNIQITNQR